MTAIYVSVCIATGISKWFGAPGLLFFRYILHLNLMFMTVIGVSYFSTAITEEKEEDTLGLMLMAGIRPLGILLGKSIGRLVQALLLIAVQYPFTLLAVTMGGVTSVQIRAAYSAMIAYMVFLAGMGLLCSTLAARNRSAACRMTVLLAAYIALPQYCRWYLGVFGTTSPIFYDVFEWIGESCVFFQISVILTSGAEVSVFSRQVITNLGMGAAGFVLSWAFFGVTNRETATEAASRGLVTRNRGFIRVFSPGRPRLDALVWKEFHFGAGGFAALLIRVALFVALYGLIIAVTQLGFMGLRWGPASWYGSTGTYLTVMMFVITFDAGLLFSRCLHEEIRGQTLSSLMMVPRPTGLILYPKMLGSFLGWLPGPLCLLLGVLWMPEGLRCAEDFFQRPGPPYLLISFFVLAPHLAALSAMYVRWAALPIGIALTIGFAFITGMFITIRRIGPEDMSVFVIATGVLCLCCACHIAVWLRTEQLSAR